MPFTSVQDLPPNPDVRIFFTGLMIIDPNPTTETETPSNPNPPNPFENTCEVFVHRSAPEHRLRIEVRRKRPGKPDIIMMGHPLPLEFTEQSPDPLRFGMRIEVGPNPLGVRRYDPPDPNNPSPEGRGLGLAIDLEGPRFHGGSIGRVDPLGGRPSILFNDAIFYTAITSDEVTPNLAIALERNQNLVLEHVPPFASTIGANIYMDEDPETRLFVDWRQDGRAKLLELKKPTGGESYEISITNEPLFEENNLQLPRHDEFREYYKILPAVPSDQQFRLNITPPPPGEPRGSTTTACMSVIKGGGGGGG